MKPTVHATTIRSTLAAALVLAAGASSSLAQDSVALTPGGNDALSSYDASSQRVRYVVDATAATTSWGQPLLIAPLVKASRDVDPMFRTQILGSISVSPNMLAGTTFVSKNFSLWTTPGGGVHPTANSAGSSIASSGFNRQFAIGLSDFSLSPSNVVTTVIGRDAGSMSRFYVERAVAIASRPTLGGADTSTLSLGGIDAAGNVVARADAFSALAATANKIIGDNIVRVSHSARGSGVNTLTASGTNSASDAAATSFIVSGESNPTNTPTVVSQGSGAFALVYDFVSRFRTGSSTANLVTGSSHLPVGTNGHRGNPSFAPVTPLGGDLGTVASFAWVSPETTIKRLMAFGLNSGATPTVAPGSPTVFTLPSGLLSPTGYNVNPTGAAVFKQYLSQTPFRGGNGQVGIGTDNANRLVLAATTSDATAGNAVVAALYAGNGSTSWSVVAHPGQSVLNGISGSAIGTLPANVTFSSPAVDRGGNVYFIANYQPNLAPVGVGLFKAVRTSAGYRLELLLQTGQTIAGANSGRTYTISAMTLNDSDSIASGSMFSQSIVQERDPGATGNLPRSIRRFGGIAVTAVLTYDNAGTNEAYDTVLFVAPGAGVDCIGDFDAGGTVSIDDVFIYINAWFANDPRADIDGNAILSIDDIFLFINAWFTPCV
jgi:hypothetical protein